MTADPQYRCYHRHDDGTLCELRREDHDQPGAGHAVEAADGEAVA